MNYKLIAIGILVAAPFLAWVAGNVVEMVPRKQVPGRTTTGPAAPSEQALSPVQAPTTPAFQPAPNAISMTFGEASPTVGQPMLDADAAPGVVPAPPPPPPPSGVLPPYPGQFRQPSYGTIYLPDGRKIG